MPLQISDRSLRLIACMAAALAIACAGCGKEPSPQQAEQPKAATPAGFVPDDAAAIESNNRGVGLMGQFKYGEALELFDGLARRFPTWHEVHVNLAIATLNRQQDGDEAAALGILERVLEDDPKNLRAEYCSGLLLEYMGENERALERFRRVAQADSRDAHAAYYTGKCLAAGGKLQEATDWYQKAIIANPYLRSSYNALSLLKRRMDETAEADRLMADFQKLEQNPRSIIVKLAYTRMGPKAEALAVDLPAATRGAKAKPDGPIFLEPVPLLKDADKLKWMVPPQGAPNSDSSELGTPRAVSITACDINNDGLIDVFIANVLNESDGTRNAVCINTGDGEFELMPEHPLAKVSDVNAALWGDCDNDGFTDVYLCRRGANQLWRQQDKGEWIDVTASTQTANGAFDTVDGAMVDFDHDGDLDIFCVNADGPNELLNNNMDGTFRAIGAERGIAGAGKGSRQVLPVDLDGDRDLDIIAINNEPPHDVWINDRGWEYVAASEFGDFIKAPIVAAVAWDAESDGQMELFTSSSTLAVDRWSLQSGRVVRESLAQVGDAIQPSTTQLSMGDLIGGGIVPLLRSVDKQGIEVLPLQSQPITLTSWPESNEVFREAALSHTFLGWATVVLDQSLGAAFVSMTESGPLVFRPGPGRHQFASISFSGREVTSDNRQVRSNVSGIGVHYAARIDSMWVSGDTLRNSSGPGQSLQPVAIGFAGHEKIDFISIDWPDGVFQSELDLKSGEHHLIVETQRQLSSCPVLFAWNGTKYEFVTDLLGVGGMGYMVAPGEYAPSRPWENVMLPLNLMQPKDGRYVIKLGEPMEEACYLDALRLVAYDVPPDWKLTLDERMNIAGPEPTGDVVCYRDEMLPVKAVNDRGEDVTSDVVAGDGRAAPVGKLDERFLGRLVTDHVMAVTFERPLLDADALRGKPTLVIDGWVEYPYSQTMFGAWQAGADYRAPTIEALGDDGRWHIVLEQFGYPAGMPRQMSVPLPVEKLPEGATRLRITTNQEIYFDRIAVAFAESCDEMIRHELPLAGARLQFCGFPRRSTLDQRRPHYDYDDRSPFWDTRHQRGMYTRFGRIDELIAQHDDGLAIFGAGEEIHAEFQADALPPLPPGWTRVFVLETHGWCKDMDLYTKDGETLEPLPLLSESNVIRRDDLHRRFNTRFESGR